MKVDEEEGTAGETNYLYNSIRLSPRSIRRRTVRICAKNAMLLIATLTSTSAPRPTRRITLPCLPSRPTNVASDNAKHIDYGQRLFIAVFQYCPKRH